MGYCMPQDGYASVSAPELQVDQARDYKPDDATWGEVLIAGAERLNDGLDSDMGEADAVDDAVSDQLDRIEDAATTAEERAGRVERTLEDMGAGR